MRSLRWALIQRDWCPYKRKSVHRDTRDVCTEKRPCEDTEKKAAVCKPGRKDSRENQPADIFILDLLPPEQWDKNFRCSRLVCGSPSRIHLPCSTYPQDVHVWLILSFFRSSTSITKIKILPQHQELRLYQ